MEIEQGRRARVIRSRGTTCAELCAGMIGQGVRAWDRVLVVLVPEGSPIVVDALEEGLVQLLRLVEDAAGERAEEIARFGVLFRAAFGEELGLDEGGRVFCAHADLNGEGAHWLSDGERCDRGVSDAG